MGQRLRARAGGRGPDAASRCPWGGHCPSSLFCERDPDLRAGGSGVLGEGAPSETKPREPVSADIPCRHPAELASLRGRVLFLVCWEAQSQRPDHPPSATVPLHRLYSFLVDDLRVLLETDGSS